MPEVDLYNPLDGIYGRDGGPYLDQVQAKEQEERRALLEGREPDPTVTHSPYIPLVTKGELLRAHGNLHTAADANPDNVSTFDEVTLEVKPVTTVDFPDEETPEDSGEDETADENDAPVVTPEPDFGE